MAEAIHYWIGSDVTFKAVVAAASREGVLIAVWVEQAVQERLEREAKR